MARVFGLVACAACLACATAAATETNALAHSSRPTRAALTLRGGARGDKWLRECKVPRKSLPADVSQALSSGRLSLEQLRNYAAIRNSPFLSALAGVSPFLRDRLIANPRLAAVIAIETALGIATLLLAEVGARGDRLLAEVDFVICDLALVVATNIALVITLSPAAPIGAAPAGLRAKLAALPSAFLQPGRFSPAERLASFAFNAVRFGAIGVASSALGASATKGLVCLRERLTGQRPDVQLAPVLATALAYGAFVAASSSTRYQLVNAIEASVLSKLPLETSALSAVLRLGNNYLGGVSWIWWARVAGVQ